MLLKKYVNMFAKKDKMDKKIIKKGSMLAMIESAERLGIEAEIIDARKGLYKLSYKGQQFIFKEVLIPINSAASVWIANHKDMTRTILAKNNIPIPPGQHFDDYDKAVSFGKKMGYPLVVKANLGTHGDYVIAEIKNITELKRAVKKIFMDHKCVIVEKMMMGKDFRILVLGDEILGIIDRIPANVVGDGQKNIAQLIEDKNNEPMRGAGHTKSLCKIKIGDEMLRILKHQNLDLDSIPAKKEQIFLRKNANVSTGGDTIDATDIIHPLAKKIAVQAVRAIGLKLGAVDYMTKDLAKSPEESDGVILEINSNPMITIHEKPYKGKPRIVSEKIIKYCFGIS
jgi:glutamate--cysteine ligase